MKIRKELYFGFVIMGLILAGAAYVLGSAETITRGHLGLLMLALVVVAIMMGFPTAFTLMGMGVLFTWIAYDRDIGRTLTLMVQSAFKVMSNDVLISIPLFVFMGYLVERANLIEKLFKSLHLSLARVPGSLAVATLFTCAVFATATGIVGAVVTLMGLLAFPQMLKAGYNVKLGAGAITAGGCLGILIPPSVMLIVYGATAGVSVVQLYAGAFFPGLMLAGLYVLYVIIVAWFKPDLAPPLTAEQRFVKLPPLAQQLSDTVSRRALPALLLGLKGRSNFGVPLRQLLGQLFIALVPALLFLLVMFESYLIVTRPVEVVQAPAGLQVMGQDAAPAAAGGLAEPPGALREPAPAGGLQEPPGAAAVKEPPAAGGLQEPPGALREPAPAGGLQEPPGATGLKEPPGAGGLQEPPGALREPPGAGGLQEPPGATGVKEPPGAGGLQEPPGALREPPGASGPQEPPGAAAAGATPAPVAAPDRPAPMGFWIAFGVGALLLVGFYALLTFQRLEIFKMLLASFFPLVVLILAVLGSIVFGLATPTEAAAVGAFGGCVLAAIYLLLNYPSEKVKRALLLWIPLWIPFFVSVSWFRFPETFGGPVPTWLGVLAIACVGVWTAFAVKQAGLLPTVRESSYLTGKTSAMVCWLFVGSAIFSAAFALLGGQELVENWVLSLGLSKTEFLILSQIIIFVLGWPLEWTEIIVIFMPIFIPLLDNFGIDPLFFGLLVALNLQTAFLSPPVAMAAFYLKGVSPPHVTLNQIFAGMLPFMAIQVLAIVLLYVFPQIGLWLPSVLYGR
jgi:TRAP-type mannitol/chloroaromatic compound transport system permease large subunit